jgi:hypothetical protein
MNSINLGKGWDKRCMTITYIENLVTELDSAQSDNILTLLLLQLQNQDAYIRHGAIHGLAKLAPRLNSVQAERVLPFLQSLFEPLSPLTCNNVNGIGCCIPTNNIIKRLASILDPALLTNMVMLIQARLPKLDTNTDKVAASFLTSLATLLDTAQVASFFDVILPQVQNPYSCPPIYALAGLAPMLNPRQVTSVLERVLPLLQKEEFYYAVKIFKYLATRLSTEQVEKVSTAVLPLLQDKDSRKRRVPVRLLVSLIPNASPDQRRKLQLIAVNHPDINFNLALLYPMTKIRALCGMKVYEDKPRDLTTLLRTIDTPYIDVAHVQQLL